MENSVGIGHHNWDGYWVSVRHAGHLVMHGPFRTAAEMTTVAADEATRIGLHGLYRGIPDTDL